MTLGLSSYLLGARGVTWLAIMVVGYFPLDVVVASMMRLWAPPRLHLSDNYLPELRSTESRDHDEVIESRGGSETAEDE